MPVTTEFIFWYSSQAIAFYRLLPVNLQTQCYVTLFSVILTDRVSHSDKLLADKLYGYCVNSSDSS